MVPCVRLLTCGLLFDSRTQLDVNSMLVVNPGNLQTLKGEQLQVPDTVVGAVLGPKARTLQEIQLYSGCKVQVFKRDARPDLPVGTRLIRFASIRFDFFS